MEYQLSKISTLACGLRSLALAVTASVLAAGAANAATFAIDFTGTERQGFTTGIFASEVVPLGQVSGSLFIDSNIPFILDTNSGTAVAVDSLTSGAVDVNNVGAISVVVNYGSISERFDTSAGNIIGEFSIQEGATVFAETVNSTIISVNGRFDFFLRGDAVSDLIAQDASLGFSRSLLESIILANAAITQGEVNNSPNGSLVFSIDSVSIRSVDPVPVNPVPLPAGLPLLLTCMGGFFVFRSRKA